MLTQVQIYFSGAAVNVAQCAGFLTNLGQTITFTQNAKRLSKTKQIKGPNATLLRRSPRLAMKAMNAMNN